MTSQSDDIRLRNREIIRSYESGESGPKIAARYGLTRERIYQILSKNGVLLREGTGKCDATLVSAAVDLVKRGMLPWHAAAQYSLPGPAVYYRCLRDGIISKTQDNNLWTDEEEQFLRAHYKRDMSATKIGEHLGRNRNEVIGKANRLGLCGNHLLEAAE